MTIRRAVPDDAENLARLIEVIWHDDKPSAAHIARAISDTHRETLVFDDGEIVGFVDAFSTISAAGVLRWEVDLLGVQQARRGKGIAGDLIAEALESGRNFGAATARAVVRVDNVAAQRAFEAHGFTRSSSQRVLCVSGGQIAQATAVTDMHLVPVNTLTYRGVWVEGVVTAEGLRRAQDAVARCKWDTAGVLATHDLVPLAQSFGYEPIDMYFMYELELR